MNRSSISPRSLFLILALAVCVQLGFAAKPSKRSKRVPSRSTVQKTTQKKVALRKGRSAAARAVVASSRRLGKGRTRRAFADNAGLDSLVAGGPWLAPTFADSTSGDNVDGEDMVIRRAAVDALGAFNGSIVVVDAQTGRILTIVNQKLAFQSGFQPCSTIKVVSALAGLSEGIIDSNSAVRLYGRYRLTLTDALAKSNNLYFANVGTRLGYDKVAQYARMFGLGEKASLNIPEEQAGEITEGPPKFGGMGMMTSFGEGIKLTPLQLVALMSAIANGGTLNYLQYPRTQADAERVVPKVKRQLPIQQLIPELMPGLLGATEFGTARRAGYVATEPVYGKTGTCTDRESPTHLGWFGSFTQIAGRKLAVVVLLTGGHHVSGPVASGIAGQIYHALAQQNSLPHSTAMTPVALFSAPSF